MNISNKDFLLQTDWRNRKLDELGTTNWVTVYTIDDKDDKSERLALFSALIPKNQVDEVLSDHSWDIMIGEVQPGPVVWHNAGTGMDKVEYKHFTDSDSIEPLVLVREFRGSKPSYIEILEEFRLFHNLYSSDSSLYIKILDDGNEDEVIRVNDKKVMIKLKELLQFISWKDMILALYFEIVRFSILEINNIDSDNLRHKHKDSRLCYSFVADKYEGMSLSRFRTLSRLLGKKLIDGPAIEESNLWPLEAPKLYEEFIIGNDSMGNDILFSSNPNMLANNFGANPENPNYLTKVFFRKSILTRYYNEPDKFTIHDGYIESNGIWFLEIDNHHPEYVVVFLGDLGRDIPYSEQRIWRSYNIVPDGNFSEVTFRRAILGEFTRPSEPVLRFKSEFSDFQNQWHNQFEWYIFKPLNPQDQYHLKALHIPLSEDQAEFDNQVISLTKILIDSLNESKFAKLITKTIPADYKGISKLEMYLEQEDVTGRSDFIQFMRKLQKVRSISAAHRKGSDFETAMQKQGINPKQLKTEFQTFIEQATELIEGLSRHFLS